jgi:hypothetical protein
MLRLDYNQQHDLGVSEHVLFHMGTSTQIAVVIRELMINNQIYWYPILRQTQFAVGPIS